MIYYIYQLNFDHCYPYIKKNKFEVNTKDGDSIEIDADSGFTRIIIKDAYESYHNGDWEDEHESGYQTYEQAKDALICITKDKFETELNRIKSLKEKC